MQHDTRTTDARHSPEQPAHDRRGRHIATAAELRDALDLRGARPWQPAGPPWPPITDTERDAVGPRITDLMAERNAHSDAHRAQLDRTARHLGREVATHQVTLADAQRRLDTMARALDPEAPVPLRVLPYREAVAVIEVAFLAGYRGAVRRVS